MIKGDAGSYVQIYAGGTLTGNNTINAAVKLAGGTIAGQQAINGELISTGGTCPSAIQTFGQRQRDARSDDGIGLHPWLRQRADHGRRDPDGGRRAERDGRQRLWGGHLPALELRLVGWQHAEPGQRLSAYSVYTYSFATATSGSTNYLDLVVSLTETTSVLNVSSGDWSNASSWTPSGAPTLAVDAQITNGGTVTIGPSETATAGSLTLGLDSNSDDTGNGINAGYVVMNGGSLTVGLTGNLRIGQGNYLYDGVGTFTLNAGTVETLTGANMRVGCFGGTGTFNQNGGILESDDYTTNISGFNPNTTAYYIGQEGGRAPHNLTAGTLQTPWRSLGYGGQGYWCGTSGYRNAPLTNGTCPGWGYFNQSGGAVNAGILTVGGGWDSGGFGTYTITAGNLTATSIRLGMLDGNGTGCQTLTNPTLGWNSTISPVGTFNQDGGTVTVTQSLIVGSDLCNFGGYGGLGHGYYNLNGGTLTDVVNGVSQGQTWSFARATTRGRSPARSRATAPAASSRARAR